MSISNQHTNTSIISTTQQHSEQTNNQRYQRLLKKLKGNLKYQYCLLAGFTILWVIITFNAMIGSFVFMNPLFDCEGQIKPQKQACLILQKCKIINSFTAVYRNGLYCEKEFIRSTVQSIFAIGLLTGMVFIPILNDFIGRRKVLMLIFLIGMSSFSLMIAAILIDNDWLLISSSLMAGVFGSGSTIISILISCDFFYKSFREVAILILCAAWGVAEMFFSIIYFYFSYWQWYLLYLLLIPSIVGFSLVLMFKIQSPLYALVIKKDLIMFSDIVMKITKYNKINQDLVKEILDQGQHIINKVNNHDKQDGNSLGFFAQARKVFCVRQNLKICLCLTGIIFSFNIFYYGMQGSMQRVGFNFGINMLFVGFTQFASYLLASYIAKFIKRKKGGIISILATSGIGLLFLTDIVKESLALQTCLISLTRISSVFAFSFFLLIETESVGVQVRSLSLGIVNVGGDLTRFFIPFMINFFNNEGISIIVVTSICFTIFGVLSNLFLRQTYVDRKLLKQNLIQSPSTEY